MSLPTNQFLKAPLPVPHRVLVVGLGTTGQAAATYFHRRGAQVTISDQGTGDPLQARAALWRQKGVWVELGEHRPDTFFKTDLILISPGVPHNQPLLQAARNRGIPVYGEIEYAAARVTAPLIAITGSNGKTTTTALTGHLLAEAGYRVFVGGNIGNPLIATLDDSVVPEVMVLEISSFQLDTAETFCPQTSVLLNIQPDHLDRYVDFAAYRASKARIFKNQTGDQATILNMGQAEVRALYPQVNGRPVCFAAQELTTQGALPRPAALAAQIRLDAIQITLPEVNDGQLIEFNLQGVRLPGAHNRENMCAALLAALLHGAPVPALRQGLKTFRGLPHRLEEVRVLDQVRYINDSKATNVASVRVALVAFTEPLVLIMGGQPKGDDFTELASAVQQRARHLIVMGEAAGEIRKALEPVVPVTTVDSMAAAVNQARQIARPGDTVLLSPACASFDMFENYGHRGECFRQAVELISSTTQLKN